MASRWRPHAAELRSVVYGMRDIIQGITSLTISSETAYSEVIMPLASAFPCLKQLQVNRTISREALDMFGQTCPHLSVLHVTPWVTCQPSADLQDTIPQLRHISVGQYDAANHPYPVIQHRCREMLSSECVTSVTLEDIYFDSKIWETLPSGVQHLNVQFYDSSSWDSLETSARVLPHLRSITAQSSVTVTASNLARVLRLVPLLEDLTLTSNSSLACPMSHKKSALYVGSSSHIADAAWINQQVLNGLRILPYGLTLEMQFQRLGAATPELHLTPRMLKDLAPFCGVMGVVLRPEGYDQQLQNMHATFPHLKYLDLHTSYALSHVQLFQLSECSALETLLLNSQSHATHSSAKLCLLCKCIPSLRVLELRRNKYVSIKHLLEKDLQDWGMQSIMVRFYWCNQ